MIASRHLHEFHIDPALFVLKCCAVARHACAHPSIAITPHDTDTYSKTRRAVKTARQLRLTGGRIRDVDRWNNQEGFRGKAKQSLASHDAIRDRTSG